MKKYTVRKYQKSDYALWNDFIAHAKNATFLFHRDFMEYHSDRFEDFSLLVFDGDKLVAILPANKVGDEVHSHQGLSYGGLVYHEKEITSTVIMIFKEVLKFLDDNMIVKMYVKMLPSVYSSLPFDEFAYALFLSEAKLYRRDCTPVIDLDQELNISKIRKRGVNKGKKHQLKIIETNDFSCFWNKILMPNLKERHGINPVHNLKEIEFLNSKFPHNIRQFNVFFQDEIVGGTTLFVTKNVVHSQYISANASQDELGSLDYLFYILFSEIFKNKKYFDFGNSNEMQGKKLNKGLSYWKESFGANMISHDFYEVETTKYYKLDDVLI